MNSNFLSKIGLSNFDIGYLFLILFIVAIVLLVLLIVALVQIHSFKKKYQKFMQGKNASSLEKDIMSLYEDNVFIKSSMEKNKKDIEELFTKHQTAFQKLGLVKYDAFKEIGGKLSFVLVLLTEEDNGFIINSMHSSREGCFTYAKEVVNGEAFVILSEEEQQALDEAKSNIGLKKFSDGE